MIKFYSIYKSDFKIRNKILKSIKKVINKNNFILGKEVDEFENKFSKYCGSKYAISCSNGTDAITLALLSLDLPKNSEVIIPAMTYASTFYAVLNAGFKPVLVDINNDDPLINFEQIRQKINNKTKVIIPVHLYGSVVDIQKLKKKINKKIIIIDDCSQAHGAYYQNKKRVGGDSARMISTFSLYPGKNLGAYGDGGIVTTDNKKICNKIKTIRNIGALKKFNHEAIGLNNRLDTIQASLLIHKLTQLDKLNKKRFSISKKYFKNIKNSKVSLLKYSKHSVYHQFVIKVKNRKKFTNYMVNNKIQTGTHYPHTINQMRYFKNNFKYEKFVNAEILARECVSLPIDPMLTKKEIEYIIKKINSY